MLDNKDLKQAGWDILKHGAIYKDLEEHRFFLEIEGHDIIMYKVARKKDNVVFKGYCPDYKTLINIEKITMYVDKTGFVG